MIGVMLFCVYSSYLHPHYHPNYSYFGMAFPPFLVINACFIPFWLIIKRRFTFIPIVGLLLCAWAIRAYCPINPLADEKDADLKILGYNVMSMGDSTWMKSPSENPIIMYLLQQDADIVCIQEANHFENANNIDTLKTVYPYVEKNTSRENSMAFLSKYEILEILELSDTTVKSRAFGYRLKVKEDTVLVINNHFESYKLLPEDKSDYKEIITNPEDNNTEYRLDMLLCKITLANRQRGLQVDWLNEYIKNCKDKYIILCGDFNDSPISYTHIKMTEHLNDAYTRGGNGPGWSYNRSGMLFRIDNILVSENFDVCKTIVDTNIDTSDHYPMISWLKMNK